jgi:hypothetical protein
MSELVEHLRREINSSDIFNSSEMDTSRVLQKIGMDKEQAEIECIDKIENLLTKKMELMEKLNEECDLERPNEIDEINLEQLDKDLDESSIISGDKAFPLK